MKSRWIWFCLGAGFVFGVVVAFDWLPWLRGWTEQWHWWVAPDVPAGRLTLFTFSLLLFGLGWWLIGRWLANNPTRRRVWIALGSLFVLITFIQIAYLGMFRQNPAGLLYEYIISNQVSGYFTAAQEIEHLPTALGNYPAQMQAFTPDPHPRSKPPGIIMIYLAIERVLANVPSISQPIGEWARSIRCSDIWLTYRSDSWLATGVVMGVLTPLVSALMMWPAYGLAKRWGVWAGWLAVGLVGLMPGRVLFAPNMDIIYPLLTLLGLYWVDRGLRRNQLSLTALGGFILSLETFLSLVNGFAGILVGVYLLLVLAEKDWRNLLKRRSVKHIAAFVIGCLSIWLVYGLVYRVTPLEIIVAARPARNDLTRNYWLWLGWNLVDFAIFTGIPVMLLALSRQTFQVSETWKVSSSKALWLAFWLVLLGLDVSGQIRAEVGRIWLMLSPVAVLLAVSVLPKRRKVQLALLGVSGLILWGLAVKWEVNPLEWPPAGEHSVTTSLPTIDNLAPTQFDPNVLLHGYDLTDNRLTLHWEATGRPRIPYSVFVHVTDETGEIVTQADGMPQNNVFPMTCWQPGDFVADSHALALDDLPNGTYAITVGIYDLTTSVRPAPPVKLTKITQTGD